MKSPRDILFIFDIDGTLANYRTGSRALHRTLIEFDRSAKNPLTHETIKRIPKAGRTDLAILKDLFDGLKLDSDIRENFISSFVSNNIELIFASQPNVCGHIQDLVKTIAAEKNMHLAVLTGNFEEIAYAKLEKISLRPYFQAGSFGDCSEERNDLFPVLMERLKEKRLEFEPDRILVIGDTPNDIRLAREFGAKAVAIACGTVAKEELMHHRPDLILDQWSGISDLDNMLSLIP